jgi:hypothetical protein
MLSPYLCATAPPPQKTLQQTITTTTTHAFVSPPPFLIEVLHPAPCYHTTDVDAHVVHCRADFMRGRVREGEQLASMDPSAVQLLHGAIEWQEKPFSLVIVELYLGATLTWKVVEMWMGAQEGWRVASLP